GEATAFQGQQASGAGTYTLTGNGALFTTSLLTSLGSYALTGRTATLTPALLSAEGSFFEADVAAAFQFQLPGSTGACILTGQAVRGAHSLGGKAGWLPRPA